MKNLFVFFNYRKAGSGTVLKKQLDPDTKPQKMNADPQPWKIDPKIRINSIIVESCEIRYWYCDNLTTGMNLDEKGLRSYDVCINFACLS